MFPLFLPCGPLVQRLSIWGSSSRFLDRHYCQTRGSYILPAYWFSEFYLSKPLRCQESRSEDGEKTHLKKRIRNLFLFIYLQFGSCRNQGLSRRKTSKNSSGRRGIPHSSFHANIDKIKIIRSPQPIHSRKHMKTKTLTFYNLFDPHTNHFGHHSCRRRFISSLFLSR